MENPYKLKGRPAAKLLVKQPLGVRHDAWQEGYTAGKAGQAEIVSELVEACEQTLISWDDRHGDGISDYALELLEKAIAKATGGD